MAQEKLKIIVIDDENDLLELSKRILERRGFEVICRTNGTNIAYLVKEHSAALVIIDELLETESGLGICEHIKSVDEISRTPVLLTSGRVLDDETEDTPIDLLPDEFLHKPFEPKDLISKVEHLLKKRLATS